MSKPFSVRLSDSLTKLVRGMSAKEKKSTSDYIREALEAKVYSTGSYRAQIISLLNAPEETIESIRLKLAEPLWDQGSSSLSSPQISFLMIHWHFAYMHSGRSGVANISYVFELLDIIKELMQESKSKNLAYDFYHTHSCLGFDSYQESFEYDYEALFAALKNEIRVSGISIDDAEMLIRPMEVEADYLGNFSTKTLSEIFTEYRLQKLFPVAVAGVNSEISMDMIYKGMRSFFPGTETLRLRKISFVLHAEPFGLIAEGENHCYPFCAESVMSLFFFSETEYFEKMWEAPAPRSRFNGASRNGLSISNDKGTVVMHENSGYRLILNEEGFLKLQSFLRSLLEDPKWEAMLERFKTFKGDI